MVTFKQFVAETKPQNGQYHLPYGQRHRGHRGLERMYNFVTKEMAEKLDMAWRNVKFNGYSIENGQIILTIAKKNTDLELLEYTAPLLLKSILLKVFPTAEVSARGGKPTPKGLPTVDLFFKATYPEEWIEYDRKAYGYK